MYFGYNERLGNQPPFLKTLATWFSLRLLPVCLTLAPRTMRKRRNDPRNHPRNHAIVELQAHQAGAIIYL